MPNLGSSVYESLKLVWILDMKRQIYKMRSA
ncbi:hypothetical protein J503_3677, partial [Acinetobacter baumannii 984213]